LKNLFQEVKQAACVKSLLHMKTRTPSLPLWFRPP